MRDLSAYFRALDDRKRFIIVRYLARHEEMTVTQLGKELHLSQPLISWHLRLLRRAGIVKTRRAGRLVWCSLDRTTLRSYQERVNRLLGLDGPPSDDDGGQQQPLEPAGQAQR